MQTDNTPARLLMLRKKFKYRNAVELYKNEKPDWKDMSPNDILSNPAVNGWPGQALQSFGLADFESAYILCYKYQDALKAAEEKSKIKDNDERIDLIDIEFEENLKEAKLKLISDIPEQFGLVLECEYAKLELIERKAISHPAFLDAYFTTTELLAKLNEKNAELKTICRLYEQRQLIPPPACLIDTDDLVPEELKCPICFYVYSGDVIQCKNGHSVCGQCYTKSALTLCPECRVFYAQVRVRNRVLESLAGSWKIGCPFSGNGCKEMRKCKEIQVHVRTCMFRDPEIFRLQQWMTLKMDEIQDVETKMKESKQLLMDLDKVEDPQKNPKPNEYAELVAHYRLKLLDLNHKRRS